jgi:hypothetical protein
MIKLKSLIIITPLFFLSQCKNHSDSELTLVNPDNFIRKDELIVLTRDMLQKKIGNIPDGKFISVKTNDDKREVIQFDDLDGDGSWDEAVFLYSFAPSENVTLSLGLSDEGTPKDATVMAHVRQRKKNADDSFGPVITKDTMPVKNPPTDFSVHSLPPYLTEGPAWENDKVAFRLYFDTRNGKDIYGKRITRMVMDSVGTKIEPSYHNLADWGMDILHVGNSLGAGAIAILTKDANGKDTLIRVGGTGIRAETYKEIADGPIRAIFSIKYSWQINNKPIQIEELTSIWGGQYFYEDRVTVSGAPPSSQLVTGIANFYQNAFGYTDTSNVFAIYSYGPQSENKDNLGMGIAVPKNVYSGFKQIKDTLTDISDTYTIVQNISAGKPNEYRFYEGWEKTDSMFTSLKGFTKFLNREALKYSRPIEIK